MPQRRCFLTVSPAFAARFSACFWTAFTRVTRGGSNGLGIGMGWMIASGGSGVCVGVGVGVG